ncbi:hypothetical protein [Pontibacter indicus]|uniref:Uncharacterized protein n=1 Tax=Pontibacter indicus TaxID=1317125 RepID=A0A1R3XRX8_9BACT|nr:hypothetical protein [Pontibacter indicus]SIT94646.1 hypothetical protein SAMN05444128_3691 [Pontibacter indicus]
MIDNSKLTDYPKYKSSAFWEAIVQDEERQSSHIGQYSVWRARAKLIYEIELKRYLDSSKLGTEKRFIKLYRQHIKSELKEINKEPSLLWRRSFNEVAADYKSENLSEEELNKRYFERTNRWSRHWLFEITLLFLKDRLHELEFTPRNMKANAKEASDIEHEQPITLAQIALFCIYTKRPLNINNADDIAKEFGLKSGEKLMRHYRKYYTASDRTASDVNNKQKEKDFKRVIDFLREKGFDNQEAKCELREFEENRNNDMKNSDRF